MSVKSQSDSEGGDDHYVQSRKTRKEAPIPDAVDHFLGLLLTGLQTRNVPELHRLYEDTFNKLADKHYGKDRWPSAESVAEQVDANELFIIFYKELYYRHVYARLQPLSSERKGSWENYCKILDLIIDDLEAEEGLSLALPMQWIWDLLDEFVYHYQSYCNFRNKAIKASKEKDVSFLKESPDIFDTKKVLTYLHDLIRTSRIQEYLANPENPDGKTGGAFTDEVVRYIGYFSLMQLLRMHSLLGDYRLAMQTIECVDFHVEVPLFYQIPACHVTLYYYMGFAYLMLRRYVDAINTFSSILAFLSKTAGVNNLSYQFENISRKQEQMHVLLLLALALCPRPLDESIERTLREKYADKQAKLQEGKEKELEFENLFQYACPKFVTGAAPDFDNFETFNANEALSRQKDRFLSEVKQQQFLPRIGAYMKLYTAITISKLAALCEMDEEALRDQLMCVMHKTRQQVQRKGAPLLDGETQSCSEVEFYLDGDMVHINAQREERPHTDVFLEHILKYQDLLKKMGKA